MSLEAAPDALGRRLGRSLPCVAQQNDKLVGAESDQHILPAAKTPQQAGRVPEDPVADEVTELVIDGLEVVQIDEETGKRRACPPRPREFLLEAGLQVPAVVKARRRVDEIDFFKLPHPRVKPQVLDQKLLVLPGECLVVLDEPLEEEALFVDSSVLPCRLPRHP